jgi:hypothetical protein
MTTTSPTPPAGKDAFLKELHQQYLGLLALLEPLDDARLATPMEEGGWAPKDVLAHVADWERYVVLRIEARRHGKPMPVWGPGDEQVDAKNAELLEANRAMSPAEVRVKAQDCHDDVVAIIESLTEAELLDDNLRRSVIGEWGSPVWLHLAANTYQHYAEHAEALKAGLGLSSDA